MGNKKNFDLENHSACVEKFPQILIYCFSCYLQYFNIKFFAVRSNCNTFAFRGHKLFLISKFWNLLVNEQEKVLLHMQWGRHQLLKLFFCLIRKKIDQGIQFCEVESIKSNSDVSITSYCQSNSISSRFS